ncbi:MAG: bifunctional diaminohydroxyphosphoribosylaminopyrimidine deaminase/5-amino-6-(5-phosphoribosylamino)uracil reductase RibD [Ignavibacteriaceae bacterium]|nr:bifunctional diaminohydroxyphosphoribosylaminopyrimidine deaminase/5-amino-6-(5-phosphoribosylamino)uracil reductase RibD [Ignavibacteriaceae bacterium]
MTSDHSKYIKRCFELAKKGKGHVSPNPLVGAILVKNGKIIGKGYHKKYGSEHAEVNAINHSTAKVAGSTLYCNLEPCCHTNKQTPPCVPLIIEKKIKKVVISNFDSNKEVNRKGVKQLQESGVEVITNVLEDEGKDLNKFYFKYVKEKLPYITLKIAQSIDGKISLARNKQTWLTGKQSIKYVHKLRSEYDAVLVGAGTIKTDNPLLTVRNVRGRNPIRIIIDGKLNIPIKSKILNSIDPENTWIITSSNADEKKVKLLSEKGLRIFKIVTKRQTKLELKKIMKVLAKQKIASILVEGGRNIFSQFLKYDMFDEVIILQAPKVLGSGIGIPNIKKIKNLKLLSVKKLGDDTKLIYGKNLAD